MCKTVLSDFLHCLNYKIDVSGARLCFRLQVIKREAERTYLLGPLIELASRSGVSSARRHQKICFMSYLHLFFCLKTEAESRFLNVLNFIIFNLNDGRSRNEQFYIFTLSY
jgi:hypothetical protein